MNAAVEMRGRVAAKRRVRQGETETVTRQPFRLDVQGLRALAVLFVVIYHTNATWLPGGYVGVDVFFVISGFLITNHLLTELSRSGRISFASFYAKRARRILPAAWVVALLTVIASVVWLAPLQLRDVFEEAIATLMYVPNVLFAVQGTDYLSETAPSLFQHYWSLGIEEQFYLLWPALLAGSFWIARGSRRRLFWLVLIVVVVSFTACVLLTPLRQSWAFFLLPTRAWELGVGGLLAFLLSSSKLHRLPRWILAVAGWLGLIGLLSAGLFYTSAINYPGVAAALPVLGTAALIVSGYAPGVASPARLLAVGPLVFIGTISYSLYLVHWPVLILPTQAGGIERDLPWWISLALAVVCIPLAYAMYRFVERPAQRMKVFADARPRRTLLAVGATMTVGVVLLGAGMWGVTRLPFSTDETAAVRAIKSPPAFSTAVPRNMEPSIRNARDDIAAIYGDGCHLDFDSVAPSGCQYGSNEGAPLVALFGDSHAAQWFPALNVLAQRGDIRLRVDTKSSCPSADVIKYQDNRRYVECETWRDNVIDELVTASPAVVILANYSRSEGFDFRDDPGGEWQDGLVLTLERLSASRTIVLADTPNMTNTPDVCLSAHLESTSTCGSERDVALDESLALAERDAAAVAATGLIDMNPYFCSQSECNPVVGQYLVYRDTNHITATFSEALSEVLLAELSPYLESE